MFRVTGQFGLKVCRFQYLINRFDFMGFENIKNTRIEVR